jgi:Pentapeptide repeats (8 copies)
LANKRHLNILRGGVKTWNKWREEHPKIQPDLSGAELNARLGFANLRGANLREAMLFGANLGGANLSRADLLGTSLDGAHLGEANLFKANLVESIGISISEPIEGWRRLARSPSGVFTTTSLPSSPSHSQ